MFLSLSAHFGLPKSDGVNTQNNEFATVQYFMDYLLDGIRKMREYLVGDGSGSGKEVIGALMPWRLCPALSRPTVAEVACRLLSVPAHAVNMERIWSAMGMANTPLRSRLDTGGLTAMMHMSLRMRAELSSSTVPREVVEPSNSVKPLAADGDAA